MQLGAIILAAGRGKRMNSKKVNKVVVHLANKPIIQHAIHLLEKMKFSLIVVVVGFAKASVMDALKDSQVVFAEQRKRLGTAHAVKCAIEKIPSHITDVLIVQGDDSAFYKEETIQKLIVTHTQNNADLTFLTINVHNPFGLGRVIRDADGKVVAVVEEKDANDIQRKIQEINPACYIFHMDFLKKSLQDVKKSPVTGEYYLTSMIDIAIKHNKKIETVQAGFMPWRGVNTREELEEAEKLLSTLES